MYLTDEDRFTGCKSASILRTDNEPEWVIFNEFVLTTRPYILTVSEVQVGWYVSY